MPALQLHHHEGQTQGKSLELGWGELFCPIIQLGLVPISGCSMKKTKPRKKVVPYSRKRQVV
jgi:hypothetical protein